MKWIGGTVDVPPRKKPISLRIDADMLDWFKKNSPGGYQTHINAVLRAYMRAKMRKRR